MFLIFCFRWLSDTNYRVGRDFVASIFYAFTGVLALLSALSYTVLNMKLYGQLALRLSGGSIGTRESMLIQALKSLIFVLLLVFFILCTILSDFSTLSTRQSLSTAIMWVDAICSSLIGTICAIHSYAIYLMLSRGINEVNEKQQKPRLDAIRKIKISQGLFAFCMINGSVPLIAFAHWPWFGSVFSYYIPAFYGPISLVATVICFQFKLYS